MGPQTQPSASCTAPGALQLSPLSLPGTSEPSAGGQGRGEHRRAYAGSPEVHPGLAVMDRHTGQETRPAHGAMVSDLALGTSEGKHVFAVDGPEPL